MQRTFVTLCLHCGLMIILALGLWQFTYKRDGHGCHMTFMYDIPEYIPVKLSKDHQRSFPNYKLYVYGEGLYAFSLRKGEYKGTPVLFLPGNAGSHRQVRSLASVALTKAVSNPSLFHFNFFTVDFNEVMKIWKFLVTIFSDFEKEMSALYGPALYRQQSFAAACIKHILSLYKFQVNPPSSVIVVGHSMGGLVARAMFQLHNFESSSVDVIISFATPQLHPVIKTDSYVENFYDEINTYWSENRNGSLNHLNLVSIGGGHRDVMVRSDLVAVPWMEASELDITVVSTAIPGVWTSMDHLCILWCNQLVLRTVRAIFKLVDVKTKQIMKNETMRNRLLQDAFLPDSTRAFQLINSPSVTDMESWLKLDSNQGFFHITAQSKPPPRLVLSLDGPKPFIVIFNAMEEIQMIVGCSPDSLESTNSNRTLCEKMWVLPCQPFQVASYLVNRRIFRCQQQCCDGATHLVITLPRSHMKSDVVMQSYDMAAQSRNTTLSESIFGSVTFDVPEQSLFFQIGFPHLTDIWLVYKVTILVSGDSCADNAGTSHFKVPWSSEDTFEILKEGGTTHIVQLFKAKDNLEISDFPSLFLYLNANCNYKVTVGLSALATLEQVLRFNCGLVPGFAIAAMLLIFSRQLKCLSVKDMCLSSLQSFSLWAVSRDVVVVHIIAVLVETVLSRISPTNSAWFLPSAKISTVIIYLFLYLACNAVVTLICEMMSFSLLPVVRLSGIITSWWRPKMELKAHKKSLKLTTVILAIFLLYIASISCGAVAFLFLSLLSGVKVLQHLQWIHEAPLGQCRMNASRHHLSLTMHFLQMTMFLLSSPAYLFWMKSERFTGPLNPDPSYIPAVVVVIFTLFAYDPVDDIFEVSTRNLSVLASVQWCVAMGILLFTAEHMNRILWILTFNTVLLTCWPLLDKNIPRKVCRKME